MLKVNDQLKKNSVIIVLGAVLSGCVGPRVPITLLDPPTVAEALKLKRIAMGEFEGRPDEASPFARDVRDMLASVHIQGKPYFEMVSSSEKADGIFRGSIVRSGATESPYQETREKCTQYETQYNKKGQAIYEACVKMSNYTVSCIRRDAGFEFAPRLIETENDSTIYSTRLQGSASDTGCSDSKQPIEGGAGLLAQARKDVLADIRKALAPVESRVAVEIMEADGSWLSRLFGGAGSMQSKASAPKFTGGFEFAKAGNMDRACEMWKEMEPIENEYVPLLYNRGLCEESLGNKENALKYYTRADTLSKTPDQRITTALARIKQQIESIKFLTKENPVFFYVSKPPRTVEQDQKKYRYPASVNSTQVTIRSFKVLPERVKAGDTLIISMDYSVMAPKGTRDVSVRETIVLKKAGKVKKTLIDEPVTQPLGGRISEVNYKTPPKLPPGTYVIEQKVQAGASDDVRSAEFVVGY